MLRNIRDERFEPNGTTAITISKFRFEWRVSVAKTLVGHFPGNKTPRATLARKSDENNRQLFKYIVRRRRLKRY